MSANKRKQELNYWVKLAGRLWGWNWRNEIGCPYAVELLDDKNPVQTTINIIKEAVKCQSFGKQKKQE